MAALQVTEYNNGTMADYGDKHRIDRKFVPEGDGTFIWVVYELTPVVDGIHPGTGFATTETAVWMPKGQGTEQVARDLAISLATA